MAAGQGSRNPLQLPSTSQGWGRRPSPYVAGMSPAKSTTPRLYAEGSPQCHTPASHAHGRAGGRGLSGPRTRTDMGLRGSLGMRAAAEDHPMCVFMTAANPGTRGVCSTTCRARPDSTILLQVGLASSQLSRRQGANTQPIRCLGLSAAKGGACSRIYRTPPSCRPMLLEVLLDTTR